MIHAKRKLFLFIAVISVAMFSGSFPRAFARAYFASEAEMIEHADVIAIVDISRVEDVEPDSAVLPYQIAYATVQNTLKGALPQNVKLYGESFFPCAIFHYMPGRYIVFLSLKGERLINCNWHLSCRPIKDTQVEWYEPGTANELSWQPLNTVIERIKNPPTMPIAK